MIDSGEVKCHAMASVAMFLIIAVLGYLAVIDIGAEAERERDPACIQEK